jgi:hypothetical protein
MAGGAAAEPIGSRLLEMQTFVKDLGHRLSFRCFASSLWCFSAARKRRQPSTRSRRGALVIDKLVLGSSAQPEQAASHVAGACEWCDKGRSGDLTGPHVRLW